VTRSGTTANPTIAVATLDLDDRPRRIVAHLLSKRTMHEGCSREAGRGIVEWDEFWPAGLSVTTGAVMAAAT
jgi:hypothetical protein